MKGSVCLAVALGGLAVAAQAQTPSSKTLDLGGFSHMKTGFWETKTSIGATGPTLTMKMCVDSSLAGQVGSLVPNSGIDCQVVSNAKTAHSVNVVQNCTMGDGITAVSRLNVGGDPDSHYEMSLNTSMTTDGKTMVSTEQIIADYKGACPADWKPGDVQFMDQPRSSIAALKASPEQH